MVSRASLWHALFGMSWALSALNSPGVLVNGGSGRLAPYTAGTARFGVPTWHAA